MLRPLEPNEKKKVRCGGAILSGTGLLFVVQFSRFCVTIDVERVGAAFLKGKDSAS